jgi:hypothetical protein
MQAPRVHRQDVYSTQGDPDLKTDRRAAIGLVGAGGVVKVLDRWLKTLGRIACLVGLHDFRVVEVTFGFGGSDAIEKLECRRCGRTAARRA